MNRPRTALMTVAAGAGLAGVVLTHSGTPTGAALGTAPPASSSSSGSASASSGGGASSAQKTSPSHRTTSSKPASAANRTGSAPAPSAGPAPAPGTVRSALGEGVNYGYGILAVKVTVSGARITAVTVPKLQVAEQYSLQLAQQVFPMLKSEVLQAQNAKIAAVSGATYTSEAYAMSLQNALSKLHVR